MIQFKADQGLRESVAAFLCDHFGFQREKTHVRLIARNRLGLLGKRRHYHVRATTPNLCLHAFAKLVRSEDRIVCHSPYGSFIPAATAEADNLRYLAKVCPTAEEIPRLIGIVQVGKDVVYLFHLVRNQTNLSHYLASLLLRRRHLKEKMISLGTRILEQTYRWQGYCSQLVEAPMEEEHAAIVRMLHEIKTLRSANQVQIAKQTASEVQRTRVLRRGPIHGDLGPRNILIGRGAATFVDWEAMQHNRLAAYDPCYLITMLTLRAIQLLLPDRAILRIQKALVARAIDLECQVTPRRSDDSAAFQIRLGLRLARLHLLSRYESDYQSGGLGARIRSRQRQIQYLAATLQGDSP